MTRREKALFNKGIDRWGWPLANAQLLRLPPAKEPEPKCVEFGAGARTNEQLLVGLRRLCDGRPAGGMPRSHIAEACGVDESVIQAVELSALRKMRHRLGAAFRAQAADLFGKVGVGKGSEDGGDNSG